MTTPLFRRVVVPVADEDDAASTAGALAPHVEGTDVTVVAVHVIEKAGGAPDKASVEQREQFAAELFDVVREGLADADIDLQTECLYGTGVAETIVDAARDRDASAIVFTPRGGNRWLKLLTGDVTVGLVTGTGVPVVVLPDRGVEGDS